MQLRALVAMLVVAPAVWAQSPAKAAYERGTAAFKKGDFGTAAAEYARADELAPNAVALQAAIDSAVKADDPVLGSELLERARTRNPEGALERSMQAATTRFQGRAGRVRVICDTCTATIDGAVLAPNAPKWTTTGAHAIAIIDGGNAETKTVEVVADAITDVQKSRTEPPKPPVAVSPPPNVVEPPPAEPRPKPIAPRPESPRGISPAFFFVGAGLTAGLTATAIGLGVDTMGKHDQFMKMGCAQSTSADCKKLGASGSDEQILANVFIGAAAAAGVATTVLAFVARWRSPAQVALVPGGAWAGARISF